MKPLKDWTLKEARNYCIDYRFSHENNCVGCKLFVQCRHSFGSFDLIPPIQEGTIKWHKYPEDKPRPGDTFDKVLIIEYGKIKVEFRNGLSPSSVPAITAWAELPDIPKWEGD